MFLADVFQKIKNAWSPEDYDPFRPMDVCMHGVLFYFFCLILIPFNSFIVKSKSKFKWMKNLTPVFDLDY